LFEDAFSVAIIEIVEMIGCESADLGPTDIEFRPF